MSRAIFLAIFLLACGPLPARGADDPDAAALRLTLPPTGYAVAGAEMGVYFDNIVLTEHPETLTFVVTSDLGGKTEKNRWTFTPTAAQVGRHPCEIEVFLEGQSVAKKSMTWQVSPARLKTPRETSLLIVGDSLTNATLYPNEVARRLNESGLSKWTMLGTHVPGNALPGVAHEGYGGWTWNRFVVHYTPDSDRLGRRVSPFVFLEGDTPKLNVPRYLQESLKGQTPEYVLFFLGINDCFGADPSAVEKTDKRIDEMFHYADLLVQDFQKGAPKARIGLCITPPGNFRQSSFYNDYKDAYTRWGWKRIQHRIVERQLEKYGTAQAAQDRIDIVPLELNLDPVDGFPENNSVHPNAVGYEQIGASIHAWLMSRLAAE